MTRTHEKLDNPVWHSLKETHKTFAINYDGVKFYHPDYCGFGGFIKEDKTTKALKEYTLLTNSFYVVGELPLFDKGHTLNKELVCNQMLLEQPIDLGIGEEIIELTTKEQQQDLLALVNLVQPGYFKNKTTELGTYFGIYKNGMLAAITGERMKMNDYTEVSSVVTHPDHTRKGYAKQLIAHTTNKIFRENKLPYLHVAESNLGAIKLYEKLGFYTRRKINFWNLIAH